MHVKRTVIKCSISILFLSLSFKTCRERILHSSLLEEIPSVGFGVTVPGKQSNSDCSLKVGREKQHWPCSQRGPERLPSTLSLGTRAENKRNYIRAILKEDHMTLIFSCPFSKFPKRSQHHSQKFLLPAILPERKDQGEVKKSPVSSA